MWPSVLRHGSGGYGGLGLSSPCSPLLGEGTPEFGCWGPECLHVAPSVVLPRSREHYESPAQTSLLQGSLSLPGLLSWHLSPLARGRCARGPCVQLYRGAARARLPRCCRDPRAVAGVLAPVLLCSRQPCDGPRHSPSCVSSFLKCTRCLQDLLGLHPVNLGCCRSQLRLSPSPPWPSPVCLRVLGPLPGPRGFCCGPRSPSSPVTQGQELCCLE